MASKKKAGRKKTVRKKPVFDEVAAENEEAAKRAAEAIAEMTPLVASIVAGSGDRIAEALARSKRRKANWAERTQEDVTHFRVYYTKAGWWRVTDVNNTEISWIEAVLAPESEDDRETLPSLGEALECVANAHDVDREGLTAEYMKNKTEPKPFALPTVPLTPAPPPPLPTGHYLSDAVRDSDAALKVQNPGAQTTAAISIAESALRDIDDVPPQARQVLRTIVTLLQQ